MNSIDKQTRIAEAENFFNLLWRNVPAGYFGYLWTTPAKKTVPFDVSNAEERHKMAVKAIELNDAGEAVYYGVNLLPFAPKSSERASKVTVALQVATVADIDVEGGTHISSDEKKYPPTFDVAKSFLPFDVSILVDSGYGLHGLCVYAEPIKITADNRAACEERNKKFLNVIRSRAGNYAKAVDGVGDLPRVLRVPGTFNLKCGRDNAPMCRVVEVNDVRFTPEDMDTRLADLIPEQPTLPATSTNTHANNTPDLISCPKTENFAEKSLQRTSQRQSARPTQYHDTDPDYDLFRARIMLDAINPTNLEYSDWLAVVSSCKNLGFSYADVDAFNQRDQRVPNRYDAEANLHSWNSLNDPSFDIETLHGVAKRFCYSERDTRRKWYELHPEKSPRDDVPAAATFLATLTAESLLAADLDFVAANVAIVQAVERINETNKFWATFDATKDLARRKLKADVDNKEPLTDEAATQVRTFLNVDKKELRETIGREAADLRKKIEAADREQKHRAAEERRKREVTARQQLRADNLERLQELRPQYCEALAAGDNERCRELAAEMYRLIHAACDVKTDRYTGEVVRYENSAHNLNLIFDYDPHLYKLFALNQFTDAIELIKTSPWASRKGEQWTDADDSELRNYLAQKYTNLRGRDVILDSVVHFANANKFHPVRDYFKKLPAWDGKPRAESVFIDWLNVDDNTFTREATLKWLCAAVCRVFHPGCSFQNAIVLQGAQGIGKSFILERLGGQWYNAITDRVDDPHAVDALRLTWLAEFKEMTAMRKADVNAIKQFIELPADTRRFAYERRARTVPRQCAFAVTVNDSEFLNDPTGARRFWILQSRSPKFGYVQSVRGEVFDDKLVAQIWAEVFARCKEMFRDGFDAAKLRLSPESERFGEEVAELFTRNDLEGEIAAFLDTKILPPVIWDLMTREERRKFFAQKNFTLSEEELEARFRGRRVTAERQAAFNAATKKGDFVLIKTGRDPDTGGITEYLTFFGTEYRQHICAAEIYNEAFGTDKRKSQITIAAVLQHLDGWALGKRIQKDPAYGDMKKTYYRNADNNPEPTDDNKEPTNDTDADPYGGEPVAPDDVPI